MKLFFSKGDRSRTTAPQSECLRSIEERGTMGRCDCGRYGDTAVTNHLESRIDVPLIARCIARFKLIGQPASRLDTYV